jgi:hypothetical protein
MSSYRDAMRAVDEQNKQHDDRQGRDGDNWLDRERQVWRRNYEGAFHGSSAAFGVGTILIVLGALVTLWTNMWTSKNALACSALVRAISNACAQVQTFHTLGILGIVIGLVLLIVGAILRRAS